MAGASTSVTVGAVLGDYRITGKLGEGGMSVVFAAENIHSPKIRKALKVIHPALEDRPGIRQRLINELELLDTLRQPPHPHILVAEDIREFGGHLFLVMELLEGDNLETFRKKQGAGAPLKQVLGLVSQSLDGLSFAHSRQIVHRDIKPSNLFLKSDGGVKILDFGIGRATASSTLTHQSGMNPGTPDYYAPEFAHGADPSPASDIYSMGITLFALLTGRLPYKGGGGTPLERQLSLIGQHVKAPLPDPHAYRDDLPSGLVNVVRRATEKTPADRFPSARAFADALDGWLGSSRLESVPKSTDDDDEATDPEVGQSRGSTIPLPDSAFPPSRTAPPLPRVAVTSKAPGPRPPALEPATVARSVGVLGPLRGRRLGVPIGIGLALVVAGLGAARGLLFQRHPELPAANLPDAGSAATGARTAQQRPKDTAPKSGESIGGGLGVGDGKSTGGGPVINREPSEVGKDRAAVQDGRDLPPKASPMPGLKGLKLACERSTREDAADRYASLLKQVGRLGGGGAPARDELARVQEYCARRGIRFKSH